MLHTVTRNRMLMCFTPKIYSNIRYRLNLIFVRINRLDKTTIQELIDARKQNNEIGRHGFNDVYLDGDRMGKSSYSSPYSTFSAYFFSWRPQSRCCQLYLD